MYILRLAVFALASVLLACSSAVDQRGAVAAQFRSAGDVNRTTSWAALKPIEQQAVLAGQMVTVPMVQDESGHRYTGGAAHRLVNASANELFATLNQPDVLQQVLPRTKRATLLGGGAQSRSIELVQGNRWVEATYTVTLERRPASSGGSYQVDFRLDRTRPHDVEDLWGSFSLTPVDARRCVVSLVAFVDLGSSPAVLFEGKIQDLILSTPWHVQRYLDQKRLASVAQ